MQTLKNFNIRPAIAEDTGIILELIKGLAEYEKLLNEVKATEESIKKYMFDQKMAEAVIAEYEGSHVGFALFFHNFSTFMGKPGIYLEDLFVKSEYRGKGFGKALLKHVAQIAIERNCGRYEWSVLDWNEPSIEFYKSLGAKFMDQWRTMRVTGEALKTLAQ